MKSLKKLISVLFVLCLLSSLAVSAYAEEGGVYDYTVPHPYQTRIYSGSIGSFAGGADYSTGSSFSQDMIQLPEDSKYYVKGIREAGRNSDQIQGGSVSIDTDRDADYVVVYGMKGDQVQYTVNYVDENGAALIPSEVYYGGIGDVMVVAYQYIEGYQPQAYNLRRTLSADPAANDFTFVYTQLITLVNPPAAAVDDAGGAVAVDGGAVPLAPAPEEIIDLDETPMGLLDMGKDAIENGAEMFGRLPVGARVGLILVDAVLIGMIVWLLVRHKRRKEAA